MSGRNQFNCLNVDTSAAAALALRAVALMDTVNNKISRFSTQSPTVTEIILGTTSERLREIPIADFDSTAEELDEYLSQHGDCSVLVRNDRYTMSDLVTQMLSVAELIEPYRPALDSLEDAQ